MTNVYGAVIMTQVIARVHPVHLTNAGQRQTADLILYAIFVEICL